MKEKTPEDYERLIRTILLALMLISVYFIIRGGVRLTASRQIETEPARPCVVIDAGHGGSDCGATRNGIYEINITLDVSKKVYDLLKQIIDKHNLYLNNLSESTKSRILDNYKMY